MNLQKVTILTASVRAALPERIPTPRPAPPLRFARLAGVLPLAALFGLSLAIGLYTRSSYLDARYVADDFDFLVQFGLVATGKWPFVSFLAAPQGPAAMPLWKAVFFLEWLVYGPQPYSMRITIGIVQAVSAVVLFLLLRRYLKYPLAAAFATLLWAGAAIGGWENPLFWLGAGAITTSVLWYLMAMLCVSRASASGALRWPALAGICTSCSIFSWGTMVPLAAGLPLQYLWLERGARTSWRRIIAWLLAWATPVAAATALTVYLALPYVDKAVSHHQFSIVNIVRRTSGQLSMALGSLTYGRVVKLQEESLAVKELLAAATALAIATLLRGDRLRLVLLAFAVVLANLVLTNVAGSSVEFESSMNSGRYLFIPTLGWCIAAGGLIDAVWDKWFQNRAPAWVSALAVVLVLTAFVAHQRVVAQTARDHFNAVSSLPREQLKTQEALFDRIAELPQSQGVPLQLPDLPVMLANPSRLLWLNSGFLTVLMADAARRFEVVPVDRLAPQRVRDRIDAVKRIGTEPALRWAGFLEACWTDFQGLQWLSHWAAANKTHVRLPNSWFTHGDIAYPIKQCAEWGFSRPLPYLVVVDDRSVSRTEVRQLIGRLEQSDDPIAKNWVVVLNQLLQDATLFDDNS